MTKVESIGIERECTNASSLKQTSNGNHGGHGTGATASAGTVGFKNTPTATINNLSNPGIFQKNSTKQEKINKLEQCKCFSFEVGHQTETTASESNSDIETNNVGKESDTSCQTDTCGGLKDDKEFNKPCDLQGGSFGIHLRLL